jgi:hypothetical protein
MIEMAPPYTPRSGWSIVHGPRHVLAWIIRERYNRNEVLRTGSGFRFGERWSLMPRSLRPYLVVAVLATLGGPMALVARAGFDTSPNPPKTITYKQFIAAGAQAVNKGMTSQFSGGPGQNPVTGTVVSQVFQDPKTKLYAYLYQITVDKSPNDQNVSRFFLARWKTTFATFTRGNDKSPVFQITSLGDNAPAADPFKLPANTVHYTEAEGRDNFALLGSFTNDKTKTGLTAGSVSAILVVFSEKGPKVEKAFGVGVTMADLTQFVYVDAYVPTAMPEPSSLLMLALGGAGVAGMSWRRRRLRRPV